MKQDVFVSLTLTALLLALPVALNAAEPKPSFAKAVEGRPNVIIILADDLGYHDLSCQGAADFKTPNLDRLATSGVRLTDGYVTAPQCASSRAGLMTAMSQSRFSFLDNSNNKGLPSPGLVQILPEQLKTAGFLGIDYKDACTHFTITDSSGWYELKGIIPGNRFINVTSKDVTGNILKTEYISISENSKLDIIVNENKYCPEKVKSVDIILLMGQSNMKGRGEVPVNQEIHPRIIYMNMTNDEWYAAVHPLHTDGVPGLNDATGNAGVGPGLDFAKVLAERDTNACIALIPCAKGGSWIDLWMPGKDMYNETIRRARKALADFSNQNIEVKFTAALWLQGESDAIEGRYQVYSAKLKTLVDSLRADLDRPNLPFISATIGSFMEDISYKYPYYKDINSILKN